MTDSISDKDKKERGKLDSVKIKMGNKDFPKCASTRRPSDLRKRKKRKSWPVKSNIWQWGKGSKKSKQESDKARRKKIGSHLKTRKKGWQIEAQVRVTEPPRWMSHHWKWEGKHEKRCEQKIRREGKQRPVNEESKGGKGRKTSGAPQRAGMLMVSICRWWCILL